jgi:hypothetical protein
VATIGLLRSWLAADIGKERFKLRVECAARGFSLAHTARLLLVLDQLLCEQPDRRRFSALVPLVRVRAVEFEMTSLAAKLARFGVLLVPQRPVVGRELLELWEVAMMV